MRLENGFGDETVLTHVRLAKEHKSVGCAYRHASDLVWYGWLRQRNFVRLLLMADMCAEVHKTNGQADRSSRMKEIRL